MNTRPPVLYVALQYLNHAQLTGQPNSTFYRAGGDPGEILPVLPGKLESCLSAALSVSPIGRETCLGGVLS